MEVPIDDILRPLGLDREKFDDIVDGFALKQSGFDGLRHPEGEQLAVLAGGSGC
jgi:hypothetical protein